MPVILSPCFKSLAHTHPRLRVWTRWSGVHRSSPRRVTTRTNCASLRVIHTLDAVRIAMLPSSSMQYTWGCCPTSSLIGNTPCVVLISVSPVTHGFVPAYSNSGLFSSRLYCSILSQNKMPGSAQFQLFRHSLLKISRALAVLVIVSPVSSRVNDITHSSSFSTACMKSSVTRTEMLALVTLSDLALMSIKSRRSG